MGAESKSVHAGRCFVTLPFILLVCQRPKSRPHRDLRYEIDLQIAESTKSGDPTWESFGSPRGPPEEPHRTPRGPPEDSHNDDDEDDMMWCDVM